MNKAEIETALLEVKREMQRNASRLDEIVTYMKATLELE